MQLSQEIFNILKGANIKLKLFDPMGNKTLDPELSARFYAYDNDFLVTIREEEDGVELVVQAGASFNFNEHKDLLNSIKKAGHNAMAEYNIRKFDTFKVITKINSDKLIGINNNLLKLLVFTYGITIIIVSEKFL